MQFPLNCTLILINYLYSPLRKGQDSSPIPAFLSIFLYILILRAGIRTAHGFPL